jgi:hypothetical protein
MRSGIPLAAALMWGARERIAVEILRSLAPACGNRCGRKRRGITKLRPHLRGEWPFRWSGQPVIGLAAPSQGMLEMLCRKIESTAANPTKQGLAGRRI